MNARTGAQIPFVTRAEWFSVPRCTKFHSLIFSNNGAGDIYILIYNRAYSAAPTTTDGLIGWMKSTTADEVPKYFDFGDSGFPAEGITVVHCTSLNTNPASVLADLSGYDLTQSAGCYS
jgi:hypothetical protein